MNYLHLVGGLILLVIGGELLVRGAVATATRFGVSPLMIGLTLVGFGTSTPELVTSLEAAFLGASGIALGNVVGSNTANILLILGLAALIAPIPVDGKGLRRDGGMMLVAAAACLAAVVLGELGRLTGCLLAAMLVGYLYALYRAQAREETVAADAAPPGDPPVLARRPAASLLLLGAGLILTIIGADQLVAGAIALSRAWSASEALIGVTIVAIGTSLPELITSVTAALRRQPELAFGNIVGSNIFNVLGILGVTAAVRPLTAPAAIADLDIWVMVGATVLLLICATTGRRLSRPEGGLFLLLYAGYLVLLLAD